MSLFKAKSPRCFNHQYIFVDERREKLDKIVESAQRDLGMLPPQTEGYADRLRGAFVNTTKHLKRRREEGERLSNKALVIALVASLLLLHYLITGSWVF